MRVALVETHAVPGVWKYDLSLAMELAALGAEVTIITSKAFPAVDERRFNGRILRDFPDLRAHKSSLSKGLHYTIAVFKAAWRIWTGRFDLVHWQHYNTLPPAETLLAKLLRLLGQELVLTVHDVRAWSVVSGRANLFIRATFCAAHRIIVHHERNKTELLERYPLDAAQVRVIPHGSFNAFANRRFDRRASREMLSLPIEGPIVLFFGEIRPEKGLVHLIRAMQSVASAIPNVRLVVAGRLRHMDMSECFAEIGEGGLHDNVILRVGYVDDELVEAYFLMADMVVLPYVAISQSGVLFEAMTVGRPVVVTDVGAMGATVREANIGLVVEPEQPAALADAIVNILTDEDTARRMSENGIRAATSNYSWARCAELTLAVYREVHPPGISDDSAPAQADS